MIGEVGKGFAVAIQTLDRSRLGIGAQALGIAQGATDYAADYAKERIAFGKPINQLRASSSSSPTWRPARPLPPANCCYKAASMAETSHPLLGKYSAMAAFCLRRRDGSHHRGRPGPLGGYGYVREYPVEQMMRDAKLTQIYEGTNEIQRVNRPHPRLAAAPGTTSRPLASSAGNDSSRTRVLSRSFPACLRPANGWEAPGIHPLTAGETDPSRLVVLGHFARCGLSALSPTNGISVNSLTVTRGWCRRFATSEVQTCGT